MQRGEIWFASTPGGDRPVLVLTRDPVADRVGSVVVAALTRTVRGLVSELELDGARRRSADRLRGELRQHPHHSARGVPPPGGAAEPGPDERGVPVLARRDPLLRATTRPAATGRDAPRETVVSRR